MNDFVRNILQICFTLAVTSCYQEHPLKADAHWSTALHMLL